jgi:hypothetical protein
MFLYPKRYWEKSLNVSSVTGDPRSSFYCDNRDGSKSRKVGSEQVSWENSFSGFIFLFLFLVPFGASEVRSIAETAHMSYYREAA